MTRNNGMRGLTEEEVKRSREEHGANVYEKAKSKSFVMRLLENLKDPIIRILLVAMAVNLLFTIKNINWAENVGMIIAIAISTIVSALSEQGSEKAFERLQENERKQRATVIRDRKTVVIPAEELVTGDLMILSAGERINADGTLIEGMLKVDESTINGESRPAEKNAAKNRNQDLYAGSLIVEGEGKAIVQRVGQNSLYGQIAKEIQTRSEDSPLKKRLSKLAKTITKIGYAAAAVVALTYLFNVFVIDSGYMKSEILLRLSNVRFVAMHLIKAVTIAMTVIVVAVPEGLPMMISVVLGANMKKMMKDNVLVRKPVGIETAGCMNVLFTDKTGTLTKGQPTCREFVFGNGERWDGKRRIDSRTADLLAHSVHLNTSVIETEKGLTGGNATERALYAFIKMKTASEEIEVLEKKPFDSGRKFSSVQIVRDGRVLTLIKGAPERIIEKCSECLNGDGNKEQFDRKRMETLVKKLSGQGRRIVALSYAEGKDRSEMPEKQVFLCIAALSDGLRENAAQAVQDLKDAGIHTVMITGDSRETAESIARECGIIDEKRRLSLGGKDLSLQTDSWIKDHLDEIAVIYRALPNDKNRLVKLSREKGLVVGMTGDGVNDAPALKNADVGFAMGCGSEIAKEAGDVIILDNDLSSIVSAVLYGRTIFKSIRKFITFQLIMNICAVGVTFFGQLLGIDHPVTVIQMLWVNIIMDTLGGLAFAGEFPHRRYLKEKPITRDEPILKRRMLAQIALMGSYGTALCTLFLKSGYVRKALSFDRDPNVLLTAFFALFIFTGVVICFTARSDRINVAGGLLKNKSFVVIMALIVCIQLMMLIFGGRTFRCTGMNLKTLLTVTLLSLTVLPVDLIRRISRKAIEKRRNKETVKNKESKKGIKKRKNTQLRVQG